MDYTSTPSLFWKYYFNSINVLEICSLYICSALIPMDFNCICMVLFKKSHLQHIPDKMRVALSREQRWRHILLRGVQDFWETENLSLRMKLIYYGMKTFVELTRGQIGDVCSAICSLRKYSEVFVLLVKGVRNNGFSPPVAARIIPSRAFLDKRIPNGPGSDENWLRKTTVPGWFLSLELSVVVSVRIAAPHLSLLPSCISAVCHDGVTSPGFRWCRTVEERMVRHWLNACASWGYGVKARWRKSMWY